MTLCPYHATTHKTHLRRIKELQVFLKSQNAKQMKEHVSGHHASRENFLSGGRNKKGKDILI